MKNRTKTISLLIAVCMMLTLLPTVAFAAGMENSTITEIKRYYSGWLEEVTITYTVGTGAHEAANTMMGIQTYEFSGDDLTNTGKYYNGQGNFAGTPHNYSDWSDIPASGPEDCGFVAWDKGGVFVRPGHDSVGDASQTCTIKFADQPSFDTGVTYYVYAWTCWSGKVYPDGYICSFSVNNSGTLVQSYPVSFDANGGTGSMNGQGFVPDEAQDLVPNAFTRTDYTFAGWNTKADGTGDSYDDKAAFKLDANATSGLTLYAQWTEKNTGTGTGGSNTGGTPGTVDPGTSSGGYSGPSIWYIGGNTFGTSTSQVPTSVEIDNVPVSFTMNGSNIVVGCVAPDADRIRVTWGSVSNSIGFTPDAAASCAQVFVPKTGDVSVMAFALMAVIAAAGAMGKK